MPRGAVIVFEGGHLDGRQMTVRRDESGPPGSLRPGDEDLDFLHLTREERDDPQRYLRTDRHDDQGHWIYVPGDGPVVFPEPRAAA